MKKILLFLAYLLISSLASAQTVIVTGLYTSTATSVTLLAGQGIYLPITPPGFAVAWYNSAYNPSTQDPNYELCIVGTRTTDVLSNLLRGQYGTTPKNHNTLGATYVMSVYTSTSPTITNTVTNTVTNTITLTPGGPTVTFTPTLTVAVYAVTIFGTPTWTWTPSITSTSTSTFTPTNSPTITMTPTISNTPTVYVQGVTIFGTPTWTWTPSITSTSTSTFTPTNSPTITTTFTQTTTATATPTYTTTATSTSTPTVTATPTTNNYAQGYNSMGQPLLSGTAMSGDTVLDSRHNQVALDFSQGIASSTAVTTLTGSAEATTLHGTAYMLCFGPGASESKLTSVNTLIYRPRVDWFFSMSSAFTTVGGSGGPSYTQAGVLNTTTGEGFWFGEEASSSAAITFGITWVSLNTGSPVTTFVPQSAWNGDTCLGQANSKFTSMGSPVALNPANLNVYDVRALWLGAGVVQFRIYSPDNTFVVVHTIAYPNSNTAPYITSATGLGLYIDANKGYTTASPSQIMYVSCMTLGTLSKERAMLDYWNDSTLADASESALVGRLLSGNYAPIGATNASGVTAMDVVVIPTNTSTPNSFTPTPTGSATPTFTNTPTYTLTPAAGAFLMDAAGNTLSSTGHALNVSDAVDHILWGSYLNTLGIGPSGTPYTQTFTPTVTVTGSATPTQTTTATPTQTAYTGIPLATPDQTKVSGKDIQLTAVVQVYAMQTQLAQIATIEAGTFGLNAGTSIIIAPSYTFTPTPTPTGTLTPTATPTATVIQGVLAATTVVAVNQVVYAVPTGKHCVISLANAYNAQSQPQTVTFLYVPSGGATYNLQQYLINQYAGFANPSPFDMGPGDVLQVSVQATTTPVGVNISVLGKESAP